MNASRRTVRHLSPLKKIILGGPQEEFAIMFATSLFVHSRMASREPITLPTSILLGGKGNGKQMPVKTGEQ